MIEFIKRSGIIFLILLNSSVFGSNIDSIKYVLKSTENDSIKTINCLRLINKIEDKLKAEESLNTIEDHLIKKNNNKLLPILYTQAAKYFKEVQKNYSNALLYTNKRIKISEQLKDSFDLTLAYKYLAIDIYTDMNLIDEALNALKTGIKYTRKNSFENAEAYYVLGWLEFNLMKYDSALTHLQKSVEIGSKTHKRNDLAEFIGWVGNAHAGIKDYKNAIKYRNEALNICAEAKNEAGVADCHRYLGQFYFALQQYDSSLYHATYAFNFIKNDSTKNKRQEYLVHTANTIVYSCIKSKKLYLGEECLKTVLNPKLIPCEYGNGSRVLLMRMLSNFYEAKGDKDKTIYYLKDYLKSKDSSNLSKQSLIVSEQLLKSNFDKEQQQLLNEQQKKDIETDAKSKRQKTIIYAGVIVLLLVIMLLYLSYKSGKQNKKSLQQISAQKSEIEHQKEIVDEKNKEIIESINYAKRLQEAILPPIETLHKKLPDFFIYYQPKDIVAGDFYWIEEMDNYLYIAVADSTGHGVPGALVSIVCSNALNRSLKEFKLTEPGLILDKTRELVLETFSKNINNVKDGMDISLVRISLNNNKFELAWAGANNPIWYINKDENYELHEIKGDKQPVGLTYDPKNFTTHFINLQKGDYIYLFTDGYADQFGGPNEKKFKYKTLKSLLVSNCNYSMKEQENKLSEVFNNWKGNLEQIDDVCIMGIKL